MVLITYVFECVDYKILFNIEAPAGKQHGEKVLLSDVTVPVGKCAANFAFKVNEILNIVIHRVVIFYIPLEASLIHCNVLYFRPGSF